MNHPDLHLVIHAPGAPGLRWLGLGPRLFPCGGLEAVWKLLTRNAFWAEQRTIAQIRVMLAGSRVVATLWQGKELVAFGRATTDGIYRAVLWDIVVAQKHQYKGYGRRIVTGLLNCPCIERSERIYVMTTNGVEFYTSLGFQPSERQELLVYYGRPELPI